MKAAVWHARRDIRIEEFPDPGPLAPDEVKLRISWCGICGTDLEEYLNGPLFIPPTDKPNPITGRHAPMVIGHEFVGQVVALGSGITDLKLDDRVAVDTLIHCGECRFCKAHQVHLCERLAIMGLMTDGGLAEYINAPRYMCFKYADGLPDMHAALAEPASVVVRAARRGRLAPGETVAIIGAGAIGLLTVEVARALGAEKIIVFEPAENRRKVAMAVGADAALDPLESDPISAVRRLTGGYGADVVFECAGNTATMSLAPELGRRASRIVLVGLHDAPVPVRLASVVIGEQELIGSFSHVYDEDFSEAVDLLSVGQIVAEPLITAQIGLQDLVRCGLEELTSSKAHHLKILVSPEG
jgi:(R,R)-butanediol dehydrogenase / meso-butanediol dehydrogenase / diacetyl reductase